jgi:rhamnulokinase
MPDPSRTSYLAFDLGAESGRAVLGHLHSETLTLREVHRFPNEPIADGCSLHWDVARLWLEMRKALAQLENENVEVTSIGVDAWGVDYALLDERGELLENPYHYRDRRTEGIMEEVLRRVSKQEIYRITGIQFMRINTLYQLFAECRQNPAQIKRARRLLTIPDLFNYWLTGIAACEFTNATTTQLVDAKTRSWSRELMDRLDLPFELPAPIVEPGSILGTLLPGLAQKSSLIGTKVVAPACHDTGSAFAAVSARDGTVFLSSGTWSLVGVEVDAPVITDEAFKLNFTNEGGVSRTTRLLKNVMGLWMLQGCRHSWARNGKSYEYPELMEQASQKAAFDQLLDPDDESFLAPADMCASIDRFCQRTHQPRPQCPGQYVRAVLESLAFKYRRVIRQLEQITGQKTHQIRIVGGGSQNRLLNQMTADATGKTVLAGPVEAAAIGNIAVQNLATGGCASIGDVRAMVDRSFPTETFEPAETDKWDRHAERFEQYCESVYA